MIILSEQINTGRVEGNKIYPAHNTVPAAERKWLSVGKAVLKTAYNGWMGFSPTTREAGASLSSCPAKVTEKE